MNLEVNIIGAGLAGVEVAWQLSKYNNIEIKLFEQKPVKFSPVHSSENFAELVCSNSLKSEKLENAEGVLKAEMEMLDSLVIKCAKKTRIPAGKALAVDRKLFSECITNKIKLLPNVEIIRKEITEIDLSNPSKIWVIATGPTTDGKLAEWLSKITNGFLNFFDAVSPIISAESINYDICFFGDRYGVGTGDYINCPLTKKEYERFYNALISSQIVKIEGFDRKLLFERCQPIEEIAKTGIDSLRYGPMKPVGITDPKSGKKPYAVVQLRKENEEGTMYNIVGFQTRLKWKEQSRIIKMIPGLENAEILRYGVMHRNTYIDSPHVLDKFLRHKKYKNLFFAGQITGVEGYAESAATGIYVGINIRRILTGEKMLPFPKKTMIGALLDYITSAKELKPMYANFGLLPLEKIIKNKNDRRKYLSNRCLEIMRNFVKNELCI
ncbi:methylenetetrahydrofolate--tRNA-(uracil(54)-C(5))-methyltransferase (FADH(2)-oxidizing) TrmFO [Thermosipho ferrireducens]|uniref:Methylenetetrahydrofolate--tRNA-(uracil-5-)-methyltransferase TrmFO n=1 Tax=Thermosipho ferrireducens TaxID=2571116 RepID=A0ABX7S4T1_9BACT|nr:methylenetetrahydrofolate--tRNA-(uracil(54)-C(5))-methyltransferase (FADH(2)-oxidizing) TrmFO [Thermosipho ferrireducens]QTA37109.1 methylenetetrahydrofolate--tRNA-(uracil(54)-C(5))-methyltransferase (FADH(2)-oxidizing) TrmFO [Thermosipho ferrireducens]